MNNTDINYIKITADRRKALRITGIDKRKCPDRRKSFRVVTDFLVKSTIKTRAKDTSENITVKMIDLNEKGCKVLLDNFIPLGSSVDITINFPTYYPLIKLSSKVIWISASGLKNNKYLCGLIFKKDNKDLLLLKKTLDDFKINKLIHPEIQFIKQPLNICHEITGVDFQIGCYHGCLYCYFNKVLERSNPVCSNGQTIDISPIYKMKSFPSNIYLSPFSEPFAPSTRELAHEFLSFLLPKGINFSILTKGIIPDKTIKLIKEYPSQIEVGIGVTNLNEQRNRILEPNVPTAQERLSNLPKLAKTGCRIGIRMDPIIPKIDDSNKTLEATVKGIAKIGVPSGFVASYLFLTRTSLKGLSKVPLVKDSIKFFTEKSPTSTGMALSIPFEEKKAKYEELSSLCKSIGSELYICTCKDIRLKNLKGVGYNLRCR